MLRVLIQFPMPISTRQESLLGTIVQAYINAARPVSSGELVDHQGFDLSPATIRNEMQALTEAGYLQQPHTSAGRIPTEKAWKWFLENQLTDHPLGKSEQQRLKAIVNEYRHRQDELIRQLAKVMAELAEESVLVAYARNDTFYTGLSNLFDQPEFERAELLQNISEVLDHLDGVIDRIYPKVGREVTVWIGKDNPFSVDCGTVITRYHVGREPAGLMAILGPIRQDYAANLALMRYTQSLLADV